MKLRNKKTGKVEVWWLCDSNGKPYTSLKQFLKDYEDAPKISEEEE